MRNILLVLPLLLLSACAKQVSVTNNAYANKKSIPSGFHKKSSFAVISLNEDDTMLSNEISQKIGSFLEKKDYEVRDAESSDYFLFFNFGISSSKGIANDPVYIPGETHTTYGNVNGYCNPGSYNAFYSQQTQSSGTVAYVPREYTLFTRGLTIGVYDANLYRKLAYEKDALKKTQVWQGTASSCGNSGDLRYIIDYLLHSLFNIFGKDTGQSIHKDYVEWFGEKAVSIP